MAREHLIDKQRIILFYYGELLNLKRYDITYKTYLHYARIIDRCLYITQMDNKELTLEQEAEIEQIKYL